MGRGTDSTSSPSVRVRGSDDPQHLGSLSLSSQYSLISLNLSKGQRHLNKDWQKEQEERRKRVVFQGKQHDQEGHKKEEYLNVPTSHIE